MLSFPFRAIFLSTSLSSPWGSWHCGKLSEINFWSIYRMWPLLLFLLQYCFLIGWEPLPVIGCLHPPKKMRGGCHSSADCWGHVAGSGLRPIFWWNIAKVSGIILWISNYRPAESIVCWQGWGGHYVGKVQALFRGFGKPFIVSKLNIIPNPHGSQSKIKFIWSIKQWTYWSPSKSPWHDIPRWCLSLLYTLHALHAPPQTPCMLPWHLGAGVMNCFYVIPQIPSTWCTPWTQSPCVHHPCSLSRSTFDTGGSCH